MAENKDKATDKKAWPLGLVAAGIVIGIVFSHLAEIGHDHIAHLSAEPPHVPPPMPEGVAFTDVADITPETMTNLDGALKKLGFDIGATDIVKQEIFAHHGFKVFDGKAMHFYEVRHSGDQIQIFRNDTLTHSEGPEFETQGSAHWKYTPHHHKLPGEALEVTHTKK